MQQASEVQSSFKSKLQALGPGILMASAAVGGSHIVMSTQAGALYGWQLAIIIILANLFKYPFFRFGVQYTLDTGKTLLEGYNEKSKAYIWIFFLLNAFATIINTAAVGLICATILNYIFPALAAGTASLIVIIVSMAILLLGHYKALDSLSKFIMIALTITTVAAVLIALSRTGLDGVASADYIGNSPWNLAALGFIVALMGWMPAPIEVAAINSMWVKAKQRIRKVSYQDGLFDFNIGFISTGILAIVFLALGALIQYGSGEAVEMVGANISASLLICMPALSAIGLVA